MTHKTSVRIKEITLKAAYIKDAPFVVLSLDQWHELEDVLEELGSPQLIKTIAAARGAYKKGKTIPYERFRKVLSLS